MREGDERASAGDDRETADFGELIVNATAGRGSLPALRQAGKLEGKVLLDMSS